MSENLAVSRNEELFKLFKLGHVNEARALQEEAGMCTVQSGSSFAEYGTDDRFHKQNDFGPHRAFDQCGSDWRGYFLNHDSLHNLYDDVVFSIYDRYKCDFGCATCYLNGQWMTDQEFAGFVPAKLEQKTIDFYLRVFEHFSRVGSIDDLCLMKEKHPHLFQFFRDHAPLMEHNMTDIAFFRQYDILMKDCRFARTAYLSFSDHVLDKADGKIVDKIIPMVAALHERSPIIKMNFILARGMATENKNVARLFEWVAKNTKIETFFHTDLRQDRDFVADLKAGYGYDLPSIYYQENSAEIPVVCQILTETIQMRNRSFYSTLTGSTMTVAEDARITKPFHRSEGDFRIADFLAGVAQSKVNTYDYYRSKITRRENNRYFEYFTWVANHVRVNHDYTFIPEFLLKPYSKMAKELVASGFTQSYAGYLKLGATKAVSIIEVKK